MYFWTQVGAEKSVNYIQAAAVNHARAVRSLGGTSTLRKMYQLLQRVEGVNPSTKRFFL